MPRPFTEAERQQFLADKHICVLSVAASDGPPAAIPIWYDYIPGGHIRINTGVNSRTARLIRQSGVVTVIVQQEELPYRYVVVEGTVVQTTTPSPLQARQDIAVRYLGEQAGRAFVARGDGADAVLFTIRPDRWRTADFAGDL